MLPGLRNTVCLLVRPADKHVQHHTGSMNNTSVCGVSGQHSLHQVNAMEIVEDCQVDGMVLAEDLQKRSVRAKEER